MNILFLIVYVALSTSGATLIKYGGSVKSQTLFNVPIVNTEISLTSLFGIFIYGISFLTFIVLLNKLSMSYLVPVATGLSYVLLMVASVAVFNEGFGIWKTIGCILILAGILLVISNGTAVNSTY